MARDIEQQFSDQIEGDLDLLYRCATGEGNPSSFSIERRRLAYERVVAALTEANDTRPVGCSSCTASVAADESGRCVPCQQAGPEHGLVTRWCDQCMSVHPADDPSCAVVVSMVPRCPTCGGHGYGPRAAYDGQPCPQCHGTGGKPDMAKSRSCGCLVTDSEYDACCGELCRKDRAAWREERFAPVTKSAPLDAYQDERRLACDLGLCEQHGSRTPREHLVVPNGNTDTEKRAEDTECDRSVTPDHRRGRFGQEVQPRDNGVLTSTGYIAPVNADGLYREDGLEASTKTPCPDCGHFQGAHLTGEGCNRRNCDCPRTYNTPAKDGNE